LGCFPTLLEIEQVSVPNNIYGTYFLPTLLPNRNKKQHDYLYWEFQMELYNLSKAKGEEKNLAQSHPEVVKEMQSIFETARTDSDVFTISSETYLSTQ